MLWLAPPVLFTAGLGFSWPKNNNNYSHDPDRELFVDARVGYPTQPNLDVGLRLRSSRMHIVWADLAPPPYDEYNDRFDLYTFELGGFAERSWRHITIMGWVGMHTAYVDASYHHYNSERESFVAGPGLVAGISLGFNVYNAGRTRVTVFGEYSFTTPVFLTKKSFGGRDYTYIPASLGVSVRF